MSIKGWPSQAKLERIIAEHVTLERVRLQQVGLSVLAHVFVRVVGTDAVEAGSTVSQINATSHSAQLGDIIRFTSGALIGLEVKAQSVSDNAIILGEDLPSAPVAAVTFQILRHKYPLVDSDGNLTVALNTAGLATEAKQDVGNASLATIAAKDFATSAKQDSAKTVLDSISALLATIDADTSALVLKDYATSAKQDTGNASLASIDSKVTAVDTGAVVVSSSALPAGASTEVTLAAVLAKIIAAPATEAKQDTQITSLAAIQTAVETMDDWDESDRAKVNPIVGQAGVQGASGTVSANTQRVVLATDVALPAGTNTIGTVNVSRLTVVDFLDTPEVLDASTNNIKGSGTALGSITAVVASLAARTSRVFVSDTTGEYIGLYVGTTLTMIIGPGMDHEIDCTINAGSAIKLRSMGTDDITTGKICIQFLG